MKIGVISDTHKGFKLAQSAIDKMGDIDILLHAGDHYSDLQQLTVSPRTKIFGVKGNCDWTGPKDQLIEVEGYKIWLIHGHQYNVKSSYQGLYYAALEKSIDIAVFGHTHTPYNDLLDGILLFNPGSAGKPRGPFRATAGIIELRGARIDRHIFEC